ncbi:MAG: MFS transporter, partial [Rhodoglobus sp.]
LGTILFTSLGSGLQTRLDERSEIPAAVRTQIVDVVVGSAGTAIPALDERSADVAADARAAFSDSTRYAALSAAGFLALGFLATLRLTGSGRREDDLER